MSDTRILIVEDEVIAAKSLELRLVRLGYTIAGITGFGEQALEIARAQRANLVLMDINLRGEMDGIQTAERMREQLDIPVIYTTAHDDAETLARAKITDPFGYLVKPFETREIRAAIEMALYKHNTDKKLRESEMRHRAISELISDLAYAARVHPDGKTSIEWLTGAGQNLFGYTAEEINAHGSLLFTVHPDDLEAVRMRAQDLFAGISRVDEYRLITKQGEPRWIRHYARPEWSDTEQRVVRLYGGIQDITERKNAQAALQDRETRYRLITEQTGQLIYEYDPSSGTIEWYGPVTQLTGYSLDEFNRLGIGGWQDHLHPDDRAAALATLAEAQQAGTRYNATYRFRRRDGSFFDVEDTGIFVRDAQNQITRMLGTMKDISERRSVELALANERTLLRTVIDHLPDLITVKDLDGNYVLNNPAHLRSLNVTHQEQVTGKNAFHFFPDHLAAQFFAYEQQVLHTNTAMLDIEEMVLDQATNQLRWHLTSRLPLRDATDKIIGLITISRNITERKIAQDELAREKVLFEQLFENAPIGIVMLDEQERVKRINSAFERLFQFTFAEIQDKPINTLIVPPHHRQEAARLSRTILRGNAVHQESVRQRRNGTLVPVEVYGVPVILKHQTIGLYGIYVDITERKHAEEQLHYASTHDALTGIFNRAYFETMLEQFKHGPRQPISIVMVDVDWLKETNDTMGHTAGDTLLRQAAQILHAAFRADDIVARIGGDEFAVILPNTDAATGAQAVARVHKALAQFNATLPPIRLSFSLGMATSQHGNDLHQTIIDADAAMYQDKSAKHSSATTHL